MRSETVGPRRLRLNVRPELKRFNKVYLEAVRQEKGESTMTGRVSSAAPVKFWRVRGAGCVTAALARLCRRRRWGRANGSYRTAARTVTKAAEAKGTTRTVLAGSAHDADGLTIATSAPAARERLGVNVKEHGWPRQLRRTVGPGTWN